MSRLSEQQVRDYLAEIDDPYTGKDLVASGWLRGIGIHEDKVSVELRLAYAADRCSEALSEQIKAQLESRPEIQQAVVSLSWRVAAHQVQKELSPHQGIKNIIAIASGKGGVGKSTTAVNLALALTEQGAQVGVLDADIYGPSQPRMLGLSGKPRVTEGKLLIPKQNYGIKTMSIGYLVEEDTPMIWRGPMVTSAMQQLLNETDWGELDYLIVDLPPGTGDIQLTLSQKIPVAGAIVVTTPQDIALLDAQRGLQMFRRVGVSVLGVVENMSVHVCSQCGHQEPIFGSGGGERMSLDHEVPLLAQLPLDIRIRQQTDQGCPTVVAEPDSDLAEAYRQMALHAVGRLSQQAKSRQINLPNVVLTTGK